MSYYKNFRIVIGTPLWRSYLRWIYKENINDFKKLNFAPTFNRKDFTCLLCGVGNEATADEFIKFVLERNQQAKIQIIDLGDEQIHAIKKLVAESFPRADISIDKINALDLENKINAKSIDWIETDGLFEFFDYDSLEKLLFVWKRLLKDDGFITTRACSASGSVEVFMDRAKVWIGNVWLGVTLYPHNRERFHDIIKSVGFKFVECPAISLYRRYSLIKDQKK